MATRTLGIKFKIAGLNEARKSLKQLKAELNNSIALNKQAVNDSVKTNIALVKSEDKRAEVVKKTNNKIFFSYLGLRANVKRQSQGMLTDVKRSIRKINQPRAFLSRGNLGRVARQFKDDYIRSYGTKSQKQQLIIKEEKSDFRKRSTYKNLSGNNRELVLEFRLAYREFFTRFEKTIEELKPEKTGFIEGLGSLLSNPISFAIDALLFPFQSAVAGAFERLGEVQTEDFAIGFNQNLQTALGLSFEETGGDVGKIIGTSLYKVYEKSVDSVDKYVKGTLRFNLADTLIDAFKYVTKTLAKELPALALRTHRRIQLNKKAIPEARRAAGIARIENKLPEGTKKDIEDNQSITLIYGGANTDSADIGKDYTARVMKPYLQGSAVIPMTRQWTNSAIDSGFQGDMRNLIKLILSNQTFAQTFKGFIAENGLNALGEAEQKELNEGLDLEGEIDLSSIDRIAEIVESLLHNKDFALGKALQATFQGYNPDDVLGAAEAISIMSQFPDKPLQIGGFSHGGYNALGTVDLLNRMGYTNVKGFSIGTPITGANATVKSDNFKAFMGDRDYYYKALTGLAGDEIDFPEFFEVGKKEGNLHSLQGYVRGDSVKGGLQEFLGDRVSIPSKAEYGKHDSAYGYAVGELGAETAIVRTILTYLGEKQLGQVNAKEGFIFSAEETLPGYTANLKKLGKGLKNEETKQFHNEYIDFLETLQAELEIAEQLAAIGKQYKPVESLQKAAKLFPQLEGLASKHTTIGLSDSEFEQAVAEAQTKEKLIFFKRKVKQQKDNIERTFQAMLGRKFSKKDESKGIYSFYEPEEYQERAGNFEGMVNWLENDVLNGASEAEKAEAQPILDLLKKITQSIRDTGSTGEFDIATAREAEELLGIDLKEFNALFKEFESQDKSKIDVNDFKQELRTFRRNRDQILSEKIIPPKVNESLKSAQSKLGKDERIQQEIINTYNAQLRKIIENAGEQAQAIIDKGEIPDNIESYESIRAKIAEYRRRLAESSFEEARRIGEELLAESESLKRVFVAGGDNRAGQLTRIQNEIISGDKAKGRANFGLAESTYVQGARQLSLDFEGIGEQAQTGFSSGANAREAGQNFAEEVTEGTKDGLDIQSPSRVFKDIGEMVKDGFNQGVDGISANLEEELNNISFSPYIVVDEKNIAAILEKGYKVGRKSVIGSGNTVENRLYYENKIRPDDVDPNINALYGLILPTDQLKPEYLKSALGYGGKNPYLLKLRDSVLEKSTLTIGDSLIKQAQNYDASPSNIKKMFQRMIETGESYLEFQYWAKERGSLIVDEIISLGNKPSQKTKDAALEYSKPMRWKELSFDNPLKPFEYIDVNNFEEINTQINAGFNLGHSAYQSGTEFGKKLIEGAKDSLGIHSPSDLFEWIGSMVKKGFELGVKGIFGDLEEELEGIDEVAGQKGFNEDINNFFADGIENISDFFEKLEDSYPIIKRVKSALVGAFGVGLQVFGIYSLTQSLGDLIRISLDTAMGIESLDRSILAVSGNALAGAKNLSFITAEARRLEIDINSAKQAYQGLLGATKDTPLQGFATEQIFSAFAETAKVRGYSQDQTTRIFAAIEQSIGKKQIEKEEIKGQLSEVMGDIQGLIATSLGVDSTQLNRMMKKGLPASEVWLKVASQLNAQNALLAGSTQTATSALTRYNNAAREFQAAIGAAFQPIQKLGLNQLAKTLDWLREKANALLKIVTALAATFAVNLLLSLVGSRAAMVLLGQALDQLVKLIITALPKLLIFLRRFILISAAIEAWSNVLKLSKSDYADAEKDIEKLTLGVEALAKAYGDATEAKENFGNSKLELQEGAKLPDNWFGRRILKPIVGGDRFNLDNLVRKRIGITTQAERKQTDFLAASGETRFRAGAVLNDKYRIAQDIEEIEKLDAKRREIESARLSLLPGDSQGYQDSLNAEQELLEQRDKFLKRTSQYQQNIDTGIQALKRRLQELAQLDLQGGDEEDEAARAKERTDLLFELENLETEKKAVAKQLSKLAKELSQFDRRLRNTNERIAGFNENQDRLTQAERTDIISAGVDLAKSDRVIQIELDDLTRRDLRRRIAKLKNEVGKLEQDIKRPAIAPGINRITNQLTEQGIEINEASLNRIIEESTVQQDKDAAKALLALRANQASLSQYQEQLAQNLQQNRTTLIDFNRTINDYFFRITQEIKEAQTEVKRLISQLFYGNIKSKLRQAIAPGSESFLNGIIESVQGIIDQAAFLAEKVLGQDSALIGFETKQYDLQTQLQDFARQIAGASDAVRGFISSLGGGRSTKAEGRSLSKPTFPIAGLNLSQARISSGYGWRNIFGRKDFHEGIDIAVKGGSNVVAANAGIVKYIKPLADQMQVGVESISATGEKVQEWYIHLARNLNVRVGDRISPGQKVGEVARTTNVARKARVSTGDHLDYRVMVDGKWVNPFEFLKRKGRYAPTVNDNFPKAEDSPSELGSDAQEVRFDTQDNNTLQQAQAYNQRLLNLEATKISGQDELINLDSRNLAIAIEQLTGKNARQFANQAREAERAFQQLRDRTANLKFEHQLPTAENELEKNLISKNAQFRDFDNEIFQRLQQLTDFVKTAQNYISTAPNIINQLKSTGAAQDIKVAGLMENTLEQMEQALPKYLKQIKEISKIQADLPQAQAEAIKFLQEQGRLKIEQQELQKQSVISQLKLNIATARGTNQERHQLELAQEKLRLETRINEIRQQYGNTDYAEELIKTEQENSAAQTTKINDGAVNRELNLEQQLINLNSDKAGKKAGLLNFMGLEFEANKVQRDNAIEAETFRYKQQIEQLKQQYRGEPEKLAQLLKNAKELNRVNLDNIQIQFKNLGTQIQQIGLQNLQGFFSNLFTLFTTSGERQQQILQANLNYAQQLNQAHDKYKRNPAELAQAKNRLKELNNQKLNNIRNEFNLFNRVVNFAKQALAEVFKSLAQIAAKKAASALFKAVGLGFADGGTVPNFADGGSVDKRIVPTSLASFLSRNSPSIQNAFQREGKRGVLAVFTPGEEILSLRTGEAQRYQALKRELGVNPLKNIANFADGGTIEGNILGNISNRPRFKFDSTSLNRGTFNSVTRTGTVNINVTTPDADSFRSSEHQLGLDAAESLRRSLRR